MRDLLLVGAVVAIVVGGVGLHSTALRAQEADDAFAVLVYTRTTGFRHLSIPEGVLAVNELGLLNGFEVEHTEDPAAFTDDNLARFAAVIFLNTTGDVLEEDGRAAFERYVRSGGGWAGIHSAADTEYDWPFYGELLAGAYFLSHPVQQPGAIDNEAPDHPSTAHLPERWLIPFEEFYSFRRSPRPDARVLLSIDEGTYLQDPNTTNLPSEDTFPEIPEGQTGVMGDHPMSWCRQVDGGRAWYTALGHEGYLYRMPDYRNHVLGGILTAAGRADADCTTAEVPPPVELPDPATPPEGPPPPAPSEPAAPAAPLPATGAGQLILVALAALALGSALRR